MADVKRKRRPMRRVRIEYLDAIPSGTLALEKVQAALEGTDIQITEFGLHEAGWVYKDKGDVFLCLKVKVTLDNPPIRKQ